jgi:predicted aldo/keto reductase-like oxidoreductase
MSFRDRSIKKEEATMQYRKDKKSENMLSILGFGCMRLPGSPAHIDREKSESLLRQAYEAGVNYFDTAYLYPGSEAAVGAIFEKLGIRDKVHIATKLPHAMCRTREDFDRLFTEEKKRLRTEYVDYYLIHNIIDPKQWERLCALGIQEWIKGKKESGEIRQIGFSYHGSAHDFTAMVDAYGWDFCQIQYNYMNTHYQAGQAGLKYAADKGLSVIIMEPLLGGKLANGLPGEASGALKEAKPGSTPAQWAFRWLWNQPEVTVVLSGMNAPGQLTENLSIADTAQPGMFTKEEETAIEKVVGIFNASYKVRCTGCNYCMPCPQGINIPGCFAAYNTSYAIGWMTGEIQYMTFSAAAGEHGHFAGDCISCGKCEQHCPQHIAIRKELKAVKRRLELPGVKWVVRRRKKQK